MTAKTGGTTMDKLTGPRGANLQNDSSSGLTRVGYFARHALEMCATMCLGTAVLTPAYVWAAGQFGYGQPLVELPELSVLVSAFAMTAPMVAWMRFRGMNWRHINEMSAAMGVEAVLIIAAYWLGILANTTVDGTSSLFLWQHGLMMPAMLIPMLLRLDVYTRKACH